MIKIDAVSPHRLSIASMASLLVLSLLFSNVAWGAKQNQWQPAVNLSDLPGRSMMQATEQHPSTGDLLVAWTENGVAQWEEIMIRRRDAELGEWMPAENLSQSEPWARDGGPALVVGQGGEIVAVWTRTYSISQGAPRNGYDVVARTWGGSTWSPEQIVLSGEAYLPGSPGTFGLLPVKTPKAVLLFITWGTGYRLARFENGAWLPPDPWVYLDVSLTEVIADEAGHLHAGALGENSYQLPPNDLFADAYYLQSESGQTWSEATNLSSVNGVASSLDLAFDAKGNLHFLWSDPDYHDSLESLQSAIWERVYDGTAWGPNVEVSTGDEEQAINGISLATGSDGTLHLGWSEGLISSTITATWHIDLDIYYQSGDGDSWGEVEKVYTSTADSRYPVIGLAWGTPYVVWQEIVPGENVLPEQEVYVSTRDLLEPRPVIVTYLPLVRK